MWKKQGDNRRATESLRLGKTSEIHRGVQPTASIALHEVPQATSTCFPNTTTTMAYNK